MILSDADKTWLKTEVFTWVSPNTVGLEFADQLYVATLAAVEDGDLAKAEQYWEAANQKHHYLPPNYNWFLGEKLALARSFIASQSLPPPGYELEVSYDENQQGAKRKTTRPGAIALPASPSAPPTANTQASPAPLPAASSWPPQAVTPGSPPPVSTGSTYLPSGPLRVSPYAATTPPLAIQASPPPPTFFDRFKSYLPETLASPRGGLFILAGAAIVYGGYKLTRGKSRGR